ncbi:hypothetical protein ACFPN4_12475 [Ureibacillus thermophilus]|uniref:Uncharacterized protein n=1 Tax=Ureibacillus thermophilus TaxID=367743 RepID=A0A4P6UPZ6_9BACL|nr:hypothetical protein [Ureibacillus thermophilus]QBK24485.1 hypothetical protein DKZ56_00270 [Ureibacillus thermophilus]
MEFGKMALILGVIAGIFSIGLWFVFVFYTASLTDSGPAITTFMMLCLPALLAIFSSWLQKAYLMFIAFIWSLPFSLYMLWTPGIFHWFFAPCAAYFICFLLLFMTKRNTEKNSIL